MQTIIVDMTPGYRMPTIYYSQGDIGRTFAIDLRSRFGDSLPASPTITIQATKPSGLGFSVASTSISGAVVTFTVTETMSNEAGRFPAELKIVKSGTTLFTANFYIECAASAHPEGTTDGDLDSISPKFMSVTTTTLPAGDSATYSFDANTNTATFGIPKGADGSLASQVLAADYSSSKTYAVGDYVYYSGNLYRCTTAITTAEAWTSGHWTQVALANDVSDVKSELNELFIDGDTFTPEWIQGWIRNDGTFGSASDDCYATKFNIGTDFARFNVGQDFKIKVYEYNPSGVAIGWLFDWRIGQFDYIVNADNLYAIMIAKTDNSNFTPQDIPSNTVIITALEKTDTSLTTKNFPADAKVVGDKMTVVDYSLIKSSNLLNMATITEEAYITKNGLQTSSSYNHWFTSDYIDVNGATTLQSNVPINAIVFYNADGTADAVNSYDGLYNSATLPISIPQTAKRFRVSIGMDWVNGAVMLNFGNELLPYVKYGAIVLNEELIEDNPKTSKPNWASTTEEYLSSYKQALKKNVDVTFFANFSVFSSLLIGFTKTTDYSNNYTDYFEITPTSFVMHRVGESDVTWQHGLTIGDYIGVTLSFDKNQRFTCTIVTNGGSYSKENNLKLGASCFPFAVISGTSVSNNKLSMTCKDLKKDVLMFGDSYFSFSAARWMYYLDATTYENLCINGYSGESSPSAINDFKTLVDLGSPKFIVWCLGMNDGSDTDDSTPSASWLSNVQSVIDFCESKNIVPILATIPSVPTINNRAKSAWVRASGYNYIDFAKAVNSDNSGNWYSGMLSNDNVHPTSEGAKALCARAVADFPQMMVLSN